MCFFFFFLPFSNPYATPFGHTIFHCLRWHSVLLLDVFCSLLQFLQHKSKLSSIRSICRLGRDLVNTPPTMQNYPPPPVPRPLAPTSMHVCRPLACAFVCEHLYAWLHKCRRNHFAHFFSPTHLFFLPSFSICSEPAIFYFFFFLR